MSKQLIQTGGQKMAIISLKQIIEEGRLKIGDRIFYEPKKRRCVLTMEDTGAEAEQTLETVELTFHYIGMLGDNVLIAAKNTGGQRFYTNLTQDYVKALEKVCDHLYSYPELGAKSMPITKEIFEQFPESRYNGVYLLGTRPEEEGMFYGAEKGKVVKRSLIGECDYLKVKRVYFLPVVVLSSDTLIDDVLNWIISDKDYEGEIPKDPKSEIIKEMLRKDVGEMKEIDFKRIKEIEEEKAELNEDIKRHESRLRCL